MSPDTLIVGGGPAGAAAAIMLAEAGIRAIVLERSRDTGDALCGGFLSWRSIETPSPPPFPIPSPGTRW